MREHLSSISEVEPSPRSHSAELAQVALASATVEHPQIPIDDVEYQESERKKNTAENLHRLQKRFGERFVKGYQMEGGGYTGNAARELLAGFMDRYGFADELKRLIPNKHGALQLLKDNHAYIHATLEQVYKDGLTHEREPAKDPYELAHSVGYELTGPFEFTRDFVQYDKQDFRSYERLCTFNSPDSRLRGYHILWLRHAEVANTAPADRLTADTLNESWKTYLKTIGRYDEVSDTYDLENLRPTRDDPYGTSSMSVQISRQGAHVSVKNRYNHTVGNPDNTLNSDLDNVAYGLKRAIYTRVGRADLMGKRTRASLAEGYITDNDGGIHAYNYEEDNVYYGEYEYISNGVVTAIDRGKYVMVSRQLYVPISGKGEEINLRPKTDSTEVSMCEDMRFLYKKSKEPTNTKDSYHVELRRQYAERDMAELGLALGDVLEAQAHTAYKIFDEMTRQFGGESVTEAAFTELLERKKLEWRDNGVNSYLAQELFEKDSYPYLVATPNVLARWRQIRTLGDQLGKGRRYGTYTSGSFLTQYSAEGLSGPLGEDAVKISIIPSVCNMKSATAEGQREQLAAMRVNQPGCNFRVPSMVEALAYWQTLHAHGHELVDRTYYLANRGAVFDKTAIRHFDLEVLPRGKGGHLLVPDSFINRSGRPFLTVSKADEKAKARVALG